MQWDVGLGRAVAHTLIISGGAALLATVFAAILSYGIYFARIPLGRLCAGWISSMLLIPVYVQATAWSAGFGIQGWLRLSQVDAAKYPWWGIASVVWIHAVAALPACFLILAHGWHRVRDGTFEQAWSELGPRYVATRIIPIKLAPWLLGGFLWTFCMVQNDMVVTNLFQVPTLCESAYQQVQFGKLRSGPIVTACLIAILCGVSVTAILHRSIQHRIRSRFGKDNAFAREHWEPVLSNRSGVVWLWSILVWSIAALTVVLPWLGMVIRIGMESRMIDGHAVRTWNGNTFLSSLLHVQDYGIEIGWSCELVFWTSLVSIALALGLITWIPFRGGSAWVLGTMVFLLALPGPIVNLSVSWLFNTATPHSLQFLGDQTLLGPILALQTRCLPVAYGILWLARTRFEDRHEALVVTDRSLPAWLRTWVWVRYAGVSITAATLACGMIAFGDLASYLLVQPPGVTTVAMRMFDLLHYGIRNREAGLALLLSAIAVLPSWWLARRIEQ